MFFRKNGEEPSGSALVKSGVRNSDRGSGLMAPSAGAKRAATGSASPSKSPFDGFNGQGAVLVGKGTRSAGEIKDATVIEIQGDYEGDVAANAVIVREGATFKGNMHAEYVEAHGLIEGAIVAERLLDIRATGLITAEVRYGQLCVATGGRLSGNIQTQVIDGSLVEGREHTSNVVPLQSTSQG